MKSHDSALICFAHFQDQLRLITKCNYLYAIALALTPEFMEQASILWLGPMVPEMKYIPSTFEGLVDIDVETLSLGDSLAGMPAVVFGGSPVTSQDVQTLLDRLDQYAITHSPISDTFVESIVELSQMKWLLLEELVQWVEPKGVECIEMEGFECDDSVCDMVGEVCPIIFGNAAYCSEEACWE